MPRARARSRRARTDPGGGAPGASAGPIPAVPSSALRRTSSFSTSLLNYGNEGNEWERTQRRKERKGAKKEIQYKGDAGTGGDTEINWPIGPDSSPHLPIPLVFLLCEIGRAHV